MAKKDDKLLTPGNIILGIIVVVLLASLFSDFIKSTNPKENECPKQNPNIVFTNMIYSENGVPYSEYRTSKPEYNSSSTYEISVTIRNSHEKAVFFSQLSLTDENLGPLKLTPIEPIKVEANSMQSITLKVPHGAYHKIDLYTDDVCEGYVVWHDLIGHDL